MTLATRLAAKTDSGGVLIRYAGGEDQYGTAKCNGANIFLTAAVTFQNEANKEDVDLVATNAENVAGVVVGTAWPNLTDLTKDSDSPYDDNIFIRYYRPISGDLLYGTIVTAGDVTIDDYLEIVGGFYQGGSTRANAVTVAREAVTGVSGTEAIIAMEWVKR